MLSLFSSLLVRRVWSFGAAVFVCGHISATANDLLEAAPVQAAVVARGDAIEVRLPDFNGVQGTLLELTEEGLYRVDKGSIIWRGALDGRMLQLPRIVEDRDRIYASFLLLDEEDEPIGAPLWAAQFDLTSQRSFSFPRPATKKGLNCLVMVDDAVELGVGHVVENITMGTILDLESDDPELYQIVDGHRIGFRRDVVEDLDERFRLYREAGMDVLGILLNPKPGSAHYDEDEVHSSDPVLFPSRAALDERHANIAAFNFESPEGIRIYRAVVEFLAERYSQPDGRYGWMSGLVIGNEIQMHWVWYNLGEADSETVLGEYLLALRLADIAGRSRHADFRVFASMTHHWKAPGSGDPKKGLSGVEMLQFLNEHGKAGGDFPWGVAFHPYPENLFRPDFWNDRTALLAMDSPRVTMNNIEVLDAYLARPALRYGDEMREIILSEQGFHGPPDEEGELLQSAALAYTFEKIGRMPAIRAFHLHRHIDHPREGGLLLGLWTHAGRAEAPDRKKAAWEVFRAIGTADWPEISEPLLELLGFSDWDEAAPAPRDAIEAERSEMLEEGLLVDLVQLVQKVKVVGAVDFRRDEFLKSAGWLVDSIFHHPPDEGSSQARFPLEIPDASNGKSPFLSFGTALSGPSVTGVVFRVYVNESLVFEHHQTAEIYTPHEVELDKWIGTGIVAILEVDSNGSNANDWGHWVEPRLMKTER